MQKILSATMAVAMLMLLTPAASASETVSAGYVGGGAFGFGLSCHEFCLGEDNPQPGTSLGGSRLYATDFYNNVIVSIQDDVFGSEGAFSICFWNPDGDNICDGSEDYQRGISCGVHAVTGSPFAGEYVTAFTYTIATTEDLDVCGTTAGTLTATFF